MFYDVPETKCASACHFGQSSFSQRRNIGDQALTVEGLAVYLGNLDKLSLQEKATATMLHNNHA
jgi:hypothetical protein